MLYIYILLWLKIKFWGFKTEMDDFFPCNTGLLYTDNNNNKSAAGGPPKAQL